MSDESSAAIRNASKNDIIEHREAYIRSGGVKGHIRDLSAAGGRAWMTHCLIKYTGRKSGNILITPLIYGDIGGEVVICASKGGADQHPAWYLNIIESETIEFQVATQAFRGTWREPEGAERDKIWAFMVDVYPPYAAYQASTDRKIPLVMMKALEEIPVFQESEATGLRKF